MSSIPLGRLMCQLAVAVAVTPIGILFFWLGGVLFPGPGSVLYQGTALVIVCVSWVFVGWEIVSMDWRQRVHE